MKDLLHRKVMSWGICRPEGVSVAMFCKVILLAWLPMACAMALELPSERYVLVLSQNDALCGRMLDKLNAGLADGDWRIDFRGGDSGFKKIDWLPARHSYRYPNAPEGKTMYAPLEGALLDLDNDGDQEFVVRAVSSVLGRRADSLYMFSAKTSERANALRAEDLRDAENKVSLAGWMYKLHSDFGSMYDPRVLEPFVYSGTAYVMFRPLFEQDKKKEGYAVIAKYTGGRIVPRDSSGQMEDVCYYRLLGPARDTE